MTNINSCLPPVQHDTSQYQSMEKLICEAKSAPSSGILSFEGASLTETTYESGSDDYYPAPAPADAKSPLQKITTLTAEATVFGAGVSFEILKMLTPEDIDRALDRLLDQSAQAMNVDQANNSVTQFAERHYDDIKLTIQGSAELAMIMAGCPAPIAAAVSAAMVTLGDELAKSDANDDWLYTVKTIAAEAAKSGAGSIISGGIAGKAISLLKSKLMSHALTKLGATSFGALSEANQIALEQAINSAGTKLWITLISKAAGEAARFTFRAPLNALEAIDSEGNFNWEGFKKAEETDFYTMVGNIGVGPVKLQNQLAKLGTSYTIKSTAKHMETTLEASPSASEHSTDGSSTLMESTIDPLYPNANDKLCAPQQ